MNLYQPNYLNQLQQIQQQLAPQIQPIPQQNANTIQYVNGLESAKAFQLPSNSSVLLMDAELPMFYIKTSDASGFCKTRQFKFEEVIEDGKTSSQFVTKEEFEQFKNDLIKEAKHESNHESVRRK